MSGKALEKHMAEQTKTLKQLVHSLSGNNRPQQNNGSRNGRNGRPRPNNAQRNTPNGKGNKDKNTTRQPPKDAFVCSCAKDGKPQRFCLLNKFVENAAWK